MGPHHVTRDVVDDEDERRRGRIPCTPAARGHASFISDRLFGLEQSKQNACNSQVDACRMEATD